MSPSSRMPQALLSRLECDVDGLELSKVARNRLRTRACERSLPRPSSEIAGRW